MYAYVSMPCCEEIICFFCFRERMRFEKESDVEDGMRSEDVYVGSGSVCVYVCVCMYVCVMVEKKMME